MPRPGWHALLVVFLAALAVRLVVGADVWDLPIVRTPKLDSFEYVSWARRLAAGDFAWPVTALHGPGYPFFLAALLTAGSGSLKIAIAVQAVVGALTATAIAATTRRWFTREAGLLAGLVYAVYGPAVYIDTALLSEGLLIALLALAVLCLAREPVTPGRATAAGAALGAATLVRPTALLTAAACVLWLLIEVRRRQPRAIMLAAALAVTCAAVTLPALAESWSASHTLNIQGYGGVNFYVGNSPLHTGRGTFRLGGGWDGLNAEASRAGVVDPAAQDRYYVAKTLDEIRAHPGAFVELLAKKALWVVQAQEVRDSHSFYFFADQSALLGVLPRMAILFPLASMGVLALLRTGRRAALLVYATVAAGAGVVLLIVGARYRMPIVPLLAIAAGAGLADLSDAVRARRWRRCATLAAMAAGAVVLSHAQSDPRNTNLAEEWAFTGSALVTEHNLPDAETAYRRALALDPESGLAWDGLGLVHYDAGRLRDAREAFTRAAAIDRDSARASFHLGLTDEREGRAEDAVARYRHALEMSPNDADVMHHLGTGLGMIGQLQEARAQMLRVVQLTPADGEAWLDLCLLSLDLRDITTASSALQRAREEGAGPQRLAFAADALARAR